MTRIILAIQGQGQQFKVKGYGKCMSGDPEAAV